MSKADEIITRVVEIELNQGQYVLFFQDGSSIVIKPENQNIVREGATIRKEHDSCTEYLFLDDVVKLRILK